MFQEWIDQARRDLDMARVAVREGYHEWGCYCSQQSAEKALKALVQLWNPGVHRNVHKTDEISKLLPFQFGNRQVQVSAGALDSLAERARYPVPENKNRAPLRVYTRQQADDAIRSAQLVLEYAERVITAIEPEIRNAVVTAEQIQ